MRRADDPREGFGLDLRRRFRPPLQALLQTLLAAAFLALLLRVFVVQGVRITSASMEETLLVGDYLFAGQIDVGARVPWLGVRLPGLRAVRPGDIVVFAPPPGAQGERSGNDYIKRVVGVAGQSVEMRGRRLYVDGRPCVEPYALHREGGGDPRRDDFAPLVVPPGHCFVLGDNRDASDDSRYWGPLPLNLVHGRAWIRYFSWDPERRRVRFERLLTRVR